MHTMLVADLALLQQVPFKVPCEVVEVPCNHFMIRAACLARHLTSSCDICSVPRVAHNVAKDCKAIWRNEMCRWYK